MATGRIDSFYDFPALKEESDRVQALLIRTLELMKKLQDGVKAPKVTGGGSGGSGGGAQAKKEVDALTRANNALKDSLKATNIELQRLKAQTTINNAEARQMAKAQGLVGGAYDKLSGQLEIARKNFRNLAAEEKHLSDEGITLSKSIAQMDAKIKAIDAAMGNHQRNVGNYAGSFNVLQNSINQVSRELPAFTVSAQTGFLAISNNLPILADAIGQVRKENVALRAEGKPTVSAFKQIAGAVFSWGSALSIGITLLTIYGGQIVKWIGSLIKAGQSIDVMTKYQKEFDEITKQATESAAKETTHLRILEKVATDATIPMEKRKRAVDELQKEYPDYLKNISDEAILQGHAADAINRAAQALYNKAFAQAAEEKAARLGGDILDLRLKERDLIEKQTAAQKEYNKEKNAKRGLVTGGGGLGVGGNVELDYVNKLRGAYDKATEAVAENRKEQAALNEQMQFFIDQSAKLAEIEDPEGKGKKTREKAQKLIEDAKSFEQERLKAIAETNKVELQLQADTQQRIANDEKRSLEERILAIYNYQKAKEAILNIDAQQEIDQLRAQRGDINKEYDDRVKQARGNSHDIAEINKQRVIELASFDKYAAEQRKKIAADLEKAKIDLVLDGKKQVLKLEADFNKDLGDLYKDAEKNFFDHLNRMVQKEFDAEKQRQKNLEEWAKKRAELLEQIRDKEIDLTSQGISTTGQFIQGAFDRRKNQIQEEIDLITKRTAAEIEAVNNSTQSAQEKADTIAAINASSQAKKEALELKQRKIDEKAAKFERAFQVFQISIDTIKAVQKIQAQAAVLASNPVTASLAGLAYAQIPLTIASGALSIASIFAKPIPKFWTGTKSSPEGLAFVGEKGTEGRINPDGSFELTPNRPTLTYLQKGTEIVPNKDLMAMLPQIAMNQPQPQKVTEEAYAAYMVQKLSAEIITGLKDVKETIKNKKETHLTLTPEGWKAAVKEGATWTEYLNRGWKD